VTPEPIDLLRGARRTLEEVVLPTLSDRFAIEQAKTVLRVLAHLEAVVDEAYPLEWGEAHDLDTFLAAASGNPDRPAAEPARLPSYRELRDENVRKKQRVADLVRGPLRQRNDSALLEAFEVLVRAQLERERRWTSPKRPAK
jgi:hypothetical protein